MKVHLRNLYGRLEGEDDQTREEGALYSSRYTLILKLFEAEPPTPQVESKTKRQQAKSEKIPKVKLPVK